MDEVTKHLHVLLEDAEKGNRQLMFVVIVPAWVDGESWKYLSSSLYNRKSMIVAANDHGFHDGAQHQRQDLLRPSPYATGVFFLQSSKAMSSYPVTDANMKLLKVRVL